MRQALHAVPPVARISRGCATTAVEPVSPTRASGDEPETEGNGFRLPDERATRQGPRGVSRSAPGLRWVRRWPCPPARPRCSSPRRRPGPATVRVRGARCRPGVNAGRGRTPSAENRTARASPAEEHRYGWAGVRRPSAAAWYAPAAVRVSSRPGAAAQASPMETRPGRARPRVNADGRFCQALSRMMRVGCSGGVAGGLSPWMPHTMTWARWVTSTSWP